MKFIAKGDFVELEFTGKVNGKVFDSNNAEDLKQVDSKAEPRKTFIIIGENMTVKGLDEALVGKELDKQYEIHISPNEGFGARKPSLVRTIPLRVFTQQGVSPRPGMSFALDNALVQIRAVSGARVIADFNNPLAGKELDYSFKILRKIDSTEEKSRIFFQLFLRSVPEFEVSDKVVVKAAKQFEPLVKLLSKKFHELVGKELSFSLVEKSVDKENTSS
jgi:FKBP-type peptidyl-prolyl cis-trans isomerase 2